jgi:uncharacterized pyridoxamine 5'-phosphate oxidase family protein
MISIQLKDELKETCARVYRLWFGDKFYIGQTKDVFNRIKQHRIKINAALSGGNKKGSYVRIVDYLEAHPDIKTAYLEVVEVCDNTCDAETMLMNSYSRYMRSKYMLNADIKSPI